MFKKIQSNLQAMMGSARISPTALYTGETWVRHGRSFPELVTPVGGLFYTAMAPVMASSRLLGGPTLQDFLLARHDLIDLQLENHIQQHPNTLVLELACGMSPRGLRMTARHPELRYIEADLPDMAARKAATLRSALRGNPLHQVVPIDAFAEDGELSLSRLFESLPADRPVMVLAEGLLNYFSRDQLELLVRNLARCFAERPGSVFVSDLHFSGHNSGLLAEVFKRALATFVRGRVHLHYQDEAEMQSRLTSLSMRLESLKPSDHAGQLASCQARYADLVRVIRVSPQCV